MLNAIVVLIRFILLILGGQKQVALENAALRQQLAVLKRSVPRPKLNNRDRLFWIGLYMIWQDWKSALMIVQPETVTSWHRKRCRRYWWKLSQSKQPSRRAWTPIFPPALANGSSDIFAIIRTGDQLLE